MLELLACGSPATPRSAAHEPMVVSAAAAILVGPWLRGVHRKALLFLLR
jgi:hypothetical protein